MAQRPTLSTTRMLAKIASHLSFLCVSVLLLSSLGKATAEEKPCTTHADGNYYDLNRLTSRYLGTPLLRLIL